MPVLSNVQTQDVIRYIDKDNNEVVGDGSLLATKYDMMGLRSGNVKFQYQINVKKDLTTLTFKEIYSSYPSNNYTKMQPYSELLADTIYEKLEESAKNIELCK